MIDRVWTQPTGFVCPVIRKATGPATPSGFVTAEQAGKSPHGSKPGGRELTANATRGR
jgi:hypothetical protein